MSHADPAGEVLRECALSGVSEYVVCAGARNAAIVLPLLQQTQYPVYHHFEERSAGFFALGRVKQKREPVAVVTTSGTAAAELLPAIIEAHYEGVPVVAITADRPAAYRGTGAPQAIEQVGLFGDYVESCIDVREGVVPQVAETWSRRAPLHWNVCLEEPTEEYLPVRWPGEASAKGGDRPRPDLFGNRVLSAFCADDEGLLVLAGPLAAGDVEEVEAFLRKLGAPILAEAASNLRELASLSGLVLQGGEGALKRLRISKVLRLGGVPSFRFWRDLEGRTEIEVMSILSGGFPGLARESVCLAHDWDDDPSPSFPERKAEPFDNRDGGLTEILRKHRRSEPSMLRRLSEVIPRGASIFLGNSLAIREWNLAAAYEFRQFSYHANRGANGIDGIVSSFLGVAAGEAEAWLICGDLTALYDLAGLWIADQLPPGRRRIVVINNRGGRIFDRLPAFTKAAAAEREFIGNDHVLDFTGWANMWGWKHFAVADSEGFVDAVDDPHRHVLIEATPDPSQTEEFWKEWEARQ
ncbi:MAG: 2-succinyl-5-enolpyruvyl-6-hydroxy-3-cyclohexene-1-carboxylic-acid synthase [Verrucomicrobiota bacterium]